MPALARLPHNPSYKAYRVGLEYSYCVLWNRDLEKWAKLIIIVAHWVVC